MKFRQFDETMSEAVSRLRGKPEWKLERMAEMLYEEAKDRFGLEKPASRKSGSEGSKKKGGLIQAGQWGLKVRGLVMCGWSM